MRKTIVLAVFLILAACGPQGPPQAVPVENETDGIGKGVPADEGSSKGQKQVTLVENLDTPWAIAFLPDGSMIFTERPGGVYVLKDGEIQQVADLNVYELSESGLHGVAVDPDFESNSYVYLYYTYENGNRVSRFILNGTLQNEEVLLDGIPSARFHDGGRIKFGPDGKLYVATGDATDPSSSQEIDSLAGKILRMNKDGSVPDDNPFGNYVYTYGHRNPQGMTWGNGVIYESEHGPTRHDEINVLEAGENYGWPRVCGDNPNAKDPLRCYTSFTLAPGGISWADGSLYVAGLRGSQLRKLELEDGKIVSEEVVVDDLGRIREVVHHNGHLYFVTSNRDGRGYPAENDDRILKLKIG